MWSLLSSLLIAPALVLFYDASQPSASSDGDSPQAAQRTASAASHSQSPKATRKSFMDDGVGAAHSVSEESETPPATEEERPDWVKAHLE